LQLCAAVGDSPVCVAVFAERAERRGWLVPQQLRLDAPRVPGVILHEQASVSSTDQGGGKRRDISAKPKSARRSRQTAMPRRQQGRHGVLSLAISDIGERCEAEGI